MKQENYIKGMIMIILSAFFFACMNVSVRLAGNLPSVEKASSGIWLRQCLWRSFYVKIIHCRRLIKNTEGR